MKVINSHSIIISLLPVSAALKSFYIQTLAMPIVVGNTLDDYFKSGKSPYDKGSQPNKMGVLGLKWLLTPLSF